MALFGRKRARDAAGPQVAEREPATGGAASAATGRVVDAMSAARRDVVERVREVNGVTEREVMAAASNVAAAVERASTQMSELKGALQRFDGGGGGVARAIRQQADTVSRHVADMVTQAQRQLATVKDAEAQAREMHRAALTIDDLATEARILALNSRLEAAKLGGQNRAFTVVADEMRRLSQAVAQTNELVRSLAERLTGVLASVADHAGATCAGLDQFAAASRASIDEVSREVGDFQATVREVVGASDESISFILGSVNGALSHLQFQDVVAQGLLRIDARIHDLQVETASLLGAPDAARDVAPAVHREVGGDKAVVNATAGEVLLF